MTAIPEKFSALAPMEGVTDIIFRQVVARATRPDVFFTEFTNVSSYASEAGRWNAEARLAFLPEENPIIPQIWGTNPEHFAITAQGLQAMGYQSIDINMGCPDKHVVANGGGSALIRTPELATEIITATRSANLPVSVKTRLGYSELGQWRDWLTLLFNQNLTMLTVHLRTKKEMSKVPAHYELIPDIIALRDQLAPHTKLVLNGNFTTMASGQAYLDQGVDGIMIGRGVFTNPFCFERQSRTHSPQELADLLYYHLDLFDEYHRNSEHIPFEPLKRFFKIYINNFPGASEIRAKLMSTKTTTEAREVLQHTNLPK